MLFKAPLNIMHLYFGNCLYVSGEIYFGKLKIIFLVLLKWINKNIKLQRIMPSQATGSKSIC